MADNERKSSGGEIEPVEEAESAPLEVKNEPKPASAAAGGGGWGGWGFSPLSYLSDLQKAAAVAAEEISRNALEAAKTAAKSISDVQPDEDSESSKDGLTEASAVEDQSEDENDERRKSALEKLEKASEESLLGQGLKVLDNSVENLASGAWQAFGSAWRGGSELVHKLENSAVNLAESIQHGGLPVAPGAVAPSLLESGRAFTAKGMQVLEQVGKETMDLLIAETGLDVSGRPVEGKMDDDQLFEEVSFDRCFYIYGGPEQLEELEALSNHYALLFNRRKTKLTAEQKAVYDGKIKLIQQIFDLSSEIDGSTTDSDKGKEVDAGTDSSIKEMKMLHDSSVSKAAELAAGFASALAGLAPSDVTQRTTGRLDSLHSEGVHRLSEMCCFAVTHLLMIGKSIISNVSKAEVEDLDEEIAKINWPEDCVEKAKLIRAKAQSMTGNVEAVCHSFMTGISDVAEAYFAAVKGSSSDSANVFPQNSIQKKVNEYSENLRADQGTALGKIQDGLQYLSYLILSTSVPSA